MTRLEGTDRDLIDLAPGGEPQNADALARRVRERVYPFLRRVTLDEHKAEDLTQDTVLAVLNSLGTLRQKERFWSWVFAIASNLAREQVRTQIRRRTIPMSSVDETQLSTGGDDADGLAEASRQELALLTQHAMSRVSERHRMVLALRFYEDLPHAEIAQVLGCSELNARAIFCRAKLGLARELKKLGVGQKGLLPALVAFGMLTLPPSAAPAATVTVSSTALAEGVLATLFTTKAKIAVALLLLVSAVGSWAFLGGGRSSASARSPASAPPASEVVSRPREAPAADMPPLCVRTICRGRSIGAKNGIPQVFEIWFYFPQGPAGPHLKRYVPVDDADRTGENWDIETADANYRFRHVPNQFHITNSRSFCAELHTAILPTDSEEFCAFVHSMEGEASHALVDKESFTFERDPVTGFVVAATDRRPEYAPPRRSAVEYNPPMQADPFAYIPPADVAVVDRRDAMHRRGWTFYRVQGHWAGETVIGEGRVPFTYTASLNRPAWLRLTIGDRLTLSDDGRQAVVQDPAGQVLLARPGGSFLKGMSRPWEGFHTLDTIRRDAAGALCRFTTTPEEVPRYKVHLLPAANSITPNQSGWTAEYTVEAWADLLETARFWRDTDAEPVCTLRIDYLQDIDEQGGAFTPPDLPASPADQSSVATPLWPLDVLPLLASQ